MIVELILMAKGRSLSSSRIFCLGWLEIFLQMDIRHFDTVHNALCLPPKILHKHCFQFLLGLTIVLGEIENNAYAKILGVNKVHYGCGSDEWSEMPLAVFHGVSQSPEMDP